MRYSHKGAARSAVLTVALGGSTADLSITGDDLTGWPTGASGRPFIACLGRGTASEEKVLCVSRAGNVLTVYDAGGVNGRAYDDTSITTHGINVTLEHVWSATEAEDLAAHIAEQTTAHGVTFSALATDVELAAAVLVETNARIAADALKAPIAAPTFTGLVTVVSPTATGSVGVRQVTISTADPSGGADGDCWLKYV
jgi:hypothetical protein